MQLLPGKIAVTRVSGILHHKFQVHGYSVHLTVRKISALAPTGEVDFGGGEYAPAARIDVVPQRTRLEDRYQWWDLSRGSYFIECNETLRLADDEIALIEPEDRLLRAGGSHAPLFVRGHVDPIELLLQVGVERLRVKENARITGIKLFRLAGSNETVSGVPKRILPKRKLVKSSAR